MSITVRHAVHRAEQAAYLEPPEYSGHSTAFQRWAMVDHATPAAVHTGFGVSQLGPSGKIDPHVHSFEESFYVLDGEPILETSETAVRLRPGDYGVISVGVSHSWRTEGKGARWADLLVPQPRPWFGDDTYFTGSQSTSSQFSREPVAVDPRNPSNRSFGHIEPHNMDPGQQNQEMLLASASMRTALLVYSGIALKMMVDSDLGAQLGTMFMVQYEPNGLAGAHDHPLEETYLILEGEVDAVFDGTPYRMSPGDVAFAGVGCVHQFSNPANVPVRWLETQSPQPPGRHSYRFVRDWEYFAKQITREP